MRFSTLFNLRKPAAQPPITSDSLPTQPPLASDSLLPATLPPEVIGGERRSSEVIGAKTEIPPWFLPDQIAWLNDHGSLRIWEKSRQVGATKTDAFDSVLKANRPHQHASRRCNQ